MMRTVFFLATLLSSAVAMPLKLTIKENMESNFGITESDGVEIDGLTYTITHQDKGVTESGIAEQGLSNNCGECAPEVFATNGQCEDWDITIEYEKYNVNSLFCGCGKKITGDNQCRRFQENAIEIVETFASNECGVHLRCRSVDYDAEPLTHKCKDRCKFLFVGCEAICKTNCYFALECDPLAVADPLKNEPNDVKKPKKKWNDDYYDDDDSSSYW